MRRVNNLEDLYSFLGSVIIRAPDRFRDEDFLPPEEQMNLERAFQELRDGMIFARERVANDTRFAELRRLLDDSLAAYQAGDEARGANLLIDFDSAVFAPEIRANERRER
jgi:hypothetical protein